MKILVFEFITGGGYAQEQLPESLANEGLVMLESLINDLSVLPSVQLTVLLDWHFKQARLPDNIDTVIVSREQCVYQILPALIKTVDWVWPIAPEMDSALQKISLLVENQSKQLLNSSTDAITICADKLTTFQVLNNNQVPVVETMQLDTFLQEIVGQWVIKPREGAGCINSYLVSNQKEYIQIVNQIEDKSVYIIQPYIVGDSLSLSCLFKDGKGWLLCCNRQNISLKQGRFELHACDVNIPTEEGEVYQQLVNRIADSITGLWGYVGIDLIQSEGKPPVILEINPRLTTSFAGIHQALGFNVAKAVIDMVDSSPVINKLQNNIITVVT